MEIANRDCAAIGLRLFDVTRNTLSQKLRGLTNRNSGGWGLS